MSTAAVPAREQLQSTTSESYASGVSWSAVIGGAFVAASTSLVLVALGTGLGLSAVSPWSNAGVSDRALSASAAIWLILTQIVSAGLGGYLAGRLRVRWSAVHADEVYFRDTAHGFLVWAVGVVVTASVLTSAALSFTGRTSQTTSSNRAEFSDSNTYFADILFRADHKAADGASDAIMRSEASHILLNAITTRHIDAEDKTYLTQLVATATGINQSDAQQRVNDVLSRERLAADAMRKQAVHSLLWIFISLLIGAFCASYAATIGGRQRDFVKASI